MSSAESLVQTVLVFLVGHLRTAIANCAVGCLDGVGLLLCVEMLPEAYW